MQSIVLVVAIGVLALIAYGDVCTRRIPNAFSLTTAVLGLARLTLAQDPPAAGHTLVAAVIIFAVGFALFWRGAIGGGDAKLATAMVLLIGHQALFAFLFLMSLCGGMLALCALARDRIGPRLIRLWCPASALSRVETASGTRQCLMVWRSRPPVSSR